MINEFAKTDFTPLLVGAIGLALVATVLFLFAKRHVLAVVVLFLAAICMRFYFGLLDPFLHHWDEAIHALVAKNMMNNPFQPVLIREPVLEYDFRDWTSNHIWLHKQPLFLWQMALSMKLFGVSEFALRLPSLLMSALLVPMTFRISTLLGLGRMIAFGAAILMLFSSYVSETAAGAFSTDHNDLAFLFYTSASLWSYLEYLRTKELKWAIIAGVFSGSAILCKWLVGLLVFLPWTINLIINNKLKWSREHRDYLLGLGSCLLVFLPWQIYILAQFPQESNWEYAYAKLHMWESLEGHAGPFFYHFDQMKRIYAPFTYLFLVPAIIYGVFILKRRAHKVVVVSSLTGVYLVYSVAETKMPGFTLVVSVLVLVMLSTTLVKGLEAIRNKKWQKMAFLYVFIAIGFVTLDLEGIRIRHNTRPVEDNEYMYNLLSTKRAITCKELGQRLEKEGIDKVFNVPFPINFYLGFYSNCIGYSRFPSEEEYERIISKNRRIAFIRWLEDPKYATNDQVLWIENPF